MLSDGNIKKQIKQVVKETDDSAVVILYGSKARGTATSESDWDILILLNKPSVSIKDEQLFRHKLYDLELKTGAPISTFVYSMYDWNTKFSSTPLHKNVEKEGVIL